MDNPLISICILTYNRANLLKECLESIYPQVTSDIEVVVSENASQDNTKEVVQKFQSKISNLRYFRNNANIGPEKNMFRVIRKAKGKYILFVGDDDILMENALGEIKNALSKNSSKNIGVILSSRRIFDNLSKRELPPIEYFNDDRFFHPGRESLLGLFLYAHGLSGIFIKRDLIDIQGAQRYIGTFYAQMFFVGKALKISSGVYIKKPLVIIRINTKKYWDYPPDFMAKPVIKMIYELTEDKPKYIRRTLIRKRIKFSIFSLRIVKNKSLKYFLKLVFIYFEIPEYRHSLLFWLYVITVGFIGNTAINYIRKFLYSLPNGRKIVSRFLFGS